MELIEEYNFDSTAIVEDHKIKILRKITFIDAKEELLIDIVNIF